MLRWLAYLQDGQAWSAAPMGGWLGPVTEGCLRDRAHDWESSGVSRLAAPLRSQSEQVCQDRSAPEYVLNIDPLRGEIGRKVRKMESAGSRSSLEADERDPTLFSG